MPPVAEHGDTPKRGRFEALHSPQLLSQVSVEAGGPFRYTKGMTTKEKAIQAVQALPDDASLEDAMERLFLLAKIERGIQQADAGELIPHEKVKERMAKWLK